MLFPIKMRLVFGLEGLAKSVGAVAGSMIAGLFALVGRPEAARPVGIASFGALFALMGGLCLWSAASVTLRPTPARVRVLGAIPVRVSAMATGGALVMGRPHRPPTGRVLTHFPSKRNVANSRCAVWVPGFPAWQIFRMFQDL